MTIPTSEQIDAYEAAPSQLAAAIAALLCTLPPEAWERTCLHPKRSEISLYDIFNLYLEHGRVHLEQIERLKRSLQQEIK